MKNFRLFATGTTFYPTCNIKAKTLENAEKIYEKLISKNELEYYEEQNIEIHEENKDSCGDHEQTIK